MFRYFLFVVSNEVRDLLLMRAARKQIPHFVRDDSGKGGVTAGRAG